MYVLTTRKDMSALSVAQLLRNSQQDLRSKQTLKRFEVGRERERVAVYRSISMEDEEDEEGRKGREVF
jgi:hypothetical protein